MGGPGSGRRRDAGIESRLEGVRDLVGRRPDHEIAKLAGCSEFKVRKYRLSLGIDRRPGRPSPVADRLEATGMKVCPSCRQDKPRAEFYVQRRGCAAPSVYCKKCSRTGIGGALVFAELMAGRKLCSLCHEAKPFSEFKPSKSRERHGCYSRCRPCATGRLRELMWDVRAKVFDAYGGRCQCECGCRDGRQWVLTIGHRFNDGAEERRRARAAGEKQGAAGGLEMYRWLWKRGCPKDRYYLQCFNCNCASQRNRGTCPGVAYMPTSSKRQNVADSQLEFADKLRLNLGRISYES